MRSPAVQAKEDASELIARSKELDAGIKKQEEDEKECKLAVDRAIVPIGNLVHDSVPIDDNEVRKHKLWAFVRGCELEVLFRDRRARLGF